MDIQSTTIADATGRLKRIEGQIRGLQQMLATDRDCQDVITQISAARKALDQVGFMLVADGLAWCIAHPEESGDGDRLEDVQRMFTKLA
jgi:DNA-binding FrmR family transcriptional regulator